MTVFKPFRPAAAVALLLCLPGLNPLPTPAAPGSALRSELEPAYSQWQRAMISRNYADWQRATATFRQALTRNSVVSQKMPFPKSVFDVPMQPPTIHRLRFLKADSKHDTAVAIYFGKADFGVSLEAGRDIPENLLVLRFIRERGAWKFDRVQYVRLLPDQRRDILNNNVAFLNRPELEPSGEVPPIPPLCPVPDFAAHIHVISIGFETRIRLNQAHEDIVSQNVATSVVTGGLREGRNTLQLQIRALEDPEPAKRKLEVAVFATPADSRKPPVRIFLYAPETTNVPTTHEADVWANAVTIPVQ